MTRSIAIVGFSLPTLAALKSSHADEIWTLNHAFVMDFAIPRMDRLFELHKRKWFLRRELPSLEKYKVWLRDKHDFPIYMQHTHKDFPSSVKYPYKEICLNIFGRLLRNGKPNPYFTSSFSYMLAMAIYERVDRVEVYGVDMGGDTEYKYQKPSGELMIGVALGRGIEVVLQPNSSLCKGMLYAYDQVPAVERPQANKLADFFDAERIRYLRQAQTLVIAYNQREIDDPSPAHEAMAYAAMYQGAGEVIRHIVQSDYFLGRQSMDKERSIQRTNEERWLAITNERHATFQAHVELSTDDGAGNAWKEYQDARWNMFVYCGARQAVQKLIDKCDMFVVPDELQMEIKDE